MGVVEGIGIEIRTYKRMINTFKTLNSHYWWSTGGASMLGYANCCPFEEDSFGIFYRTGV